MPKMKNKRILLLWIELALLKLYEGFKCEKCNVVQGKPNDKLGIRKFYCSHISNRVSRKLSKEKTMLYVECLKQHKRLER